MQRYLLECRLCRSVTSKAYARAHDGLCKHCADPSAVRSSDTPTRNERILECGYQAYAREEDYYGYSDR